MLPGFDRRVRSVGPMMIAAIGEGTGKVRHISIATLPVWKRKVFVGGMDRGRRGTGGEIVVDNDAIGKLGLVQLPRAQLSSERDY